MWGDIKKFCTTYNIPRSTYYLYKRQRKLGELKASVRKPRDTERARILKENGVNYYTYKWRIANGWSETEARYTPAYQYRLPDGRLLKHALTINQYHQAWLYINDEGMSVEEAYNTVLHGRSSVRAHKYEVDGVPLKEFCKEHGLNYVTARRYINKQITFERSSKNVDSVVSALRGKKVHIGRWGKF